MPTKVYDKARVEIKANMRVSLDIKLKNDINGMKHSITLSSIVEDILEDGCLIRTLLRMKIILILLPMP